MTACRFLKKKNWIMEKSDGAIWEVLRKIIMITASPVLWGFPKGATR